MATDPEIIRRIAALERLVFLEAVDPGARSSASAALTSAADAAALAAAAEAAADAAANAAADAQSQAASAASTASTAQQSADGKNTVYRQSTTPTVPTGGHKVNDLWFNTGDNNNVHTWNGSTWVSVRDATIAAAASAASAAQTTANGRNRIYRQSTQPTGGADGDLWFNTGADNKPYIYSLSSGWTAYTLGPSAIVVGNLDAGAITTGSLAADRIATTALNANNLTSGTIAAGRITTDSIASASINAGNITTGNITGRNYFSATSGNRVIIGPDVTYGGTARISFDTDGSGASMNDPYLAADSSGLFINGPIVGNEMSFVWLQQGALWMAAEDTSGTATGININPSSNVIDLYGGSLTTQAIVSSGTHQLTGSAVFQAATLGVTGTTGTANLSAGPSGVITKLNSSTKRIKADIADLSAPNLGARRLYDLPVRQFRFAPGAIPETDQRHGVLVPGFVAEEVAEIYPIAADLNEDGTVETWNDRFLIPAMLKLIQEQHKRIEALERRGAPAPPP